jgi:hypothetical protein
MSITLKNGKTITDDELDAMAEPWETGTWTGHLGKVHRGRPSLCEGDVETISFKLPVSQVESIDDIAKQHGISRSEFIRDAIDKELIALAA